jgi:hypothetical protein
VVLHGLGAGTVAGLGLGLAIVAIFPAASLGGGGRLVVQVLLHGAGAGLAGALCAHASPRFSERRGLRTFLGALPGLLFGVFLGVLEASLVDVVASAAIYGIPGAFAGALRLVVRPPQAADRFRDAVSDVFE